MENTQIHDDLRAVAQYVETALMYKSFVPGEPPKALNRVWALFKKSVEERTIPISPDGLTVPEWSTDPLLVVLRHLYHLVPNKETPLSFLAVFRFLNSLGRQEEIIYHVDAETGRELLGVLKRLQDEDFVFGIVCARCGIFLGR
ncbi:MAG: hypothetical protein G01um101429_77 [Parcubacteria group bacterium Gr01-1014_29]|nr:MAG: hypothetical protein G01um101429_77 [Parcubacteria group bacterium Gr01-1014_29]